MGRSQFGFKEGTGTREALFGLQVLIQNCRDVKKDVFLCFIDFEKAFDKVKHNKLLTILSSMNIDKRNTACIKNLYWNQSAHISTKDGTTKDIKIMNGVR